MSVTNTGISRRVMYGVTAGNVALLGFNLLAAWLVAFSSSEGFVAWALASFALGALLAVLGFGASFFPRRWDAVIANGLLSLAYAWFWLSFMASIFR